MATKCRGCKHYICICYQREYAAPRQEHTSRPIEPIRLRRSDTQFLNNFCDDLDDAFGMDAGYDPFSGSVIGDR